MLGRVCGMERQRGLACAIVTGIAVTRFHGAASLLMVLTDRPPEKAPICEQSPQRTQSR